MTYFWIWLVLACWLGAVCAGWWITTLRARRFGRGFAPPGAPRTRPLFILRPLAGAEDGLYERLFSNGRVHSARPVVLRFAVATPLDPAYRVAQQAARDLNARSIDASVVVTGGGGPNRKVAQLAAVMATWPQDEECLVAVIDSDVDLSRFDFNVLGDLLESDERLGAVWAPPVDGGELMTFGDWASHATLNGSFHAFPLLGGISPKCMVGKTFAMRNEALDAVGGFDAFVDYLGEDVELASRLAEKGLAVRPAPVTTRTNRSGRRFHDVVARMARWMAVIRAQRPLLMLTYPLFFFAASLIVPAGTLLGTFADGSIAALGAFLALSAMLTRVGLVIVARRRSGQPVSILTAVIDAIVGDLVIFLAFVRAYRDRKVHWRGVPLALDRSGRLVASK